MLLQGKSEYQRITKEALMLEMMPDLEKIRKEKSPRILNSHLPFRWLPKKHGDNGWKIVHVRRNPKDVLVSTYHHMKTNGDVGGMGRDVNWEKFVDTYMNGHCEFIIVVSF